MKISEILQIEKDNENSILLFKEGIFWRCYERSVLHFIKNIKKYSVFKKFFKTVNQEIVYLGFPDTIIEEVIKIAKSRNYTVQQNKKDIKISGIKKVSGFLKWKNNTEMSKTEIKGVNENNHRQIIQKIIDYPIMNKTPVEAFNFLAKIQTEPAAAFTASQTSINPGTSVQFTDQSTNNPTSWSWEFGDGGTSTSQNPSHTYSSVGNYTVSLTATNSYGSDTETKTNYITVSTSGGETGTVTDYDGNTYNTIKIGNQWWMAENLKTTHYAGGASLIDGEDGTFLVLDGYFWLSTESSSSRAWVRILSCCNTIIGRADFLKKG